MTKGSTNRRAVEDANACLHSAGLPTVTDLLHALALMLENSGNVHATACTLFAVPPGRCNCALGVARTALKRKQ